jgi:hypothetical protein
MAVSEGHMDTSLAALEEDDCRTSIAEARSALSAREERALPYQVIAFCELRRGHPARAERAFAAGVARDPENWELHRDLAVVRALQGRDPRPHARRAKRLNPHEEQAANVSAIFARSPTPGAWRRAAKRINIHVPGPPTP